MFTLCPNDLVIISPNVMMTIIILFCWVSIHRLLLLSLHEACTLFLYFLWAVCTDTSSNNVWAWETVPIGCIHVWVIYITPGWFCTRRSCILSSLQTFCHSSTYQTNGGTGGAGRTGRFSPSLFRAGPRSHLWNQFRCVLVTTSGAGFHPYHNFWGADMGPLGVMMVKWTTVTVVSLSLSGDG